MRKGAGMYQAGMYQAGMYQAGRRVPVVSLHGFGLLGGILCGLAAIGGVTLAAFGVGASRRLRWLRRHGQRIQVTFSYVGPDPTTTVNGKHPYIVRAAFRDPSTGQLYVATSEGGWEDPKPALMLDPTVTVLFDPRNPKRCAVEL